ncbi:MAG: ATP-dependent helicase HrpB [Vicinamibacteraceae bacterium]
MPHGLDPLPIDAHVDAVVDAVRRHRAAVVVAPPGAGKTTRLPPALAADGPVLVLQPRRVAARAIARRIADERGWTLGQEVGWHVRFERRFTAATRVLLATEGILTARLVDDPLISGVRTIVLDEFHERSIHADLGLALARQAWAARDDLRVVVMSATLAAGPVARFLDDCPIVEVPGRPHPLDIAYAPGESVAEAVRTVWPGSRGSVLCFLPGAPEIRRAHAEVAQAVPGAEVVDLFGALDADQQDRAVRGSGRRVILATNIAETSLTVSGVDTVVDTGLHKVARYDATRALDTLDTERVSQASADQRAGRAARLGPGRARRLWDARDRLSPHGEPDIARIDLAGPLLDLAAWGTDADAFAWFEAPPAEAVAAARALLRRLGAIDGAALTPLGRQMQALPLPPRLARILIEAGGARDAARACAILSERQLVPARRETTTCDLLGSLDAWASLPPHVHQVSRQIEDLAGGLSARQVRRGAFTEVDLRRALFVGYADRLARRRDVQGTTLVLATGTGAVLGRESGVRDGEFVVALDVQAPTRPGDPHALVRVASRVEPEWIVPTQIAVEHAFDARTGRVRAWRRERFDRLVLAEHAQAPEPAAAAEVLAEAWLARETDETNAAWLRRVRFAGLDIDLPALVRQATPSSTSLADVDLAAHAPYALTRDLERLAPSHLDLPSGRRAALLYDADGTISASAKLQELFGLAETPRVGPAGVPVVLSLLAPNGRPVQTTRDLRSFWDRTYPEVRKELRGRYPRHPWPEDPWTATPTARVKPRPRS